MQLLFMIEAMRDVGMSAEQIIDAIVQAERKQQDATDNQKQTRRKRRTRQRSARGSHEVVPQMSDYGNECEEVGEQCEEKMASVETHPGDDDSECTKDFVQNDSNADHATNKCNALQGVTYVTSFSFPFSPPHPPYNPISYTKKEPPKGGSKKTSSSGVFEGEQKPKTLDQQWVEHQGHCSAVEEQQPNDPPEISPALSQTGANQPCSGQACSGQASTDWCEPPTDSQTAVPSQNSPSCPQAAPPPASHASPAPQTSATDAKPSRHEQPMDPGLARLLARFESYAAASNPPPTTPIDGAVVQ